MHCKAIPDGRLYFFINHTIPLFSNCLFLIKCCSSEGWKLSRNVLNRKKDQSGIQWNVEKKKIKLKGISVFNPKSSKIPLECATVFWGMAVLVCVFTLLSLTVIHQIVSEHQHYLETGRDTMKLNNLFLLNLLWNFRHKEVVRRYFYSTVVCGAGGWGCSIHWSYKLL